MSSVVSVTSGKGGVGKSSFCCYLARALASQGKSTVVVELDCGLRGLDIMLGVSESVYDFGDLLSGRCELSDAVCPVPGTSNLFLIAAPSAFERFPTCDEVSFLCRRLKSKFDYIVIDTSAGYALTKIIPQVSDQVLLIVTPDPVCVRDASLVAGCLRQTGNQPLRLVINKVNRNTVKKELMPDLDAVIDRVGVQLLGVIPEHREILFGSAKGLPLEPGRLPAKVFRAIAARLDGEHVPLTVH